MELYFIDIATGVTFHGTKPYIHWFEDGQSVNLFYYKPIYFISDEATLYVRCAGFFKLFDSSKLGTIVTLHGKKFEDLTPLLTDAVTSVGVAETINNDTYYVHAIYVCAHSDMASEFRDDILISPDIDVLTDSPIDYEKGETIEVGADFYNEDEMLKSNLQNMGLEIPDGIQTSIYESNIYEEGRDNILLNRKFKELLLNYGSIVAQKGSYNSLRDSLSWFEYGDLLELNEYWKKNQTLENGKLLAREITDLLGDEYRQYLNQISKTTYISISLALQEIAKRDDRSIYDDDDIVIDYNDAYAALPDSNPTLVDKILLWNKIELSLKMTLLGNFYATYFMPIHLDLIHSAIEDIIFAPTLKILSGSAMARQDYADFVGSSFICLNRRDHEEFYIEPVEAYVYRDTLFGSRELPNPLDWTDYENNTIGVEPLRNNHSVDPFYIMAHWVDELGVVIPFEVFIKDNIYYNSWQDCDMIVSSTVTIIDSQSRANTVIDADSIIYPIQDSSGEPSYYFNFWLLIKTPEQYKVTILFKTLKGITYSRTFNFVVRDDAKQSLEVYKVNRIPVDDFYELPWRDITRLHDPADVFFHNWNNLHESQVRIGLPNAYTQYIPTTNTNTWQAPGLNNIQIVDLEDTNYGNIGFSVLDIYNNTINIPYSIGDDINTLRGNMNTHIPWYWWIVMKRAYWTNNNPMTVEDFLQDIPNQPQHYFLMGIRKPFSIAEHTQELYNYNNEIIINQNNGVVRLTFDNTKWELLRGIPIQTVTVETEIEYDFRNRDNTNHIEHIVVTAGDPCGNKAIYGLDTHRVTITGSNPITTMDEEKFFPILHTLEYLNETPTIDQNEMVAVVPEFNRSLPLTDVYWTFTNESTSQSYALTDHNNYNISPLEPYAAPTNDGQPLTPGYYRVELNYSTAPGVTNTLTYDAAFKINK